MYAKDIESHAEEILMPIASKMPEMILEFIGKRIELDKTKEGIIFNSYSSIPYKFYKLKKPLAQNIEQTINIVSGWYENQSENFIDKGAKLLSIIFPDFPKPFEKKLLTLIQTGEDKNFAIVIDILRNYRGEVFLHEICKALIKALPQESKKISDVQIILTRTDAVIGEYGLVEAYESRKEKIKEWSGDKNKKVREFANSFIESLENRIISERRRATEDIALLKHQYGINNEN